MGHLYLYCLYLEIEEKTALFISVYYSNWELRKTFASKTQNSIRKVWRKISWNHGAPKIVEFPVKSASTAEFWILKTREGVRNRKKLSNSIFLHSTTETVETADDNAKKWSSLSPRDRPGTWWQPSWTKSWQHYSRRLR